MLIRTEAPADILAIDRLLKKTFPTNKEADLVMQLRENSNLTLSLVACNDEGELVGHIMFSPVSVNGEFGYWQGLGPIAVSLDYQGQGIGSRLVTQGLEFLCDFSYPVCVVLGNPNFYVKLGFKDASLYGLSCPWDVEPGAFQVIDIYDGALQGISGVVNYSPEFSRL
jgi:putative acetyltransferase